MSIHVHENFIQGKDLENILGFSKSFNPEDKFLWGYNDIINLKYKNKNNVISSLDKCVLFLNEEFLKNYNLRNDLKVINIFGAGLQSGKKYTRHQDKEYTYEGKTDLDVVYTGLLYLNDDYVGGELLLEYNSSDNLTNEHKLIKPKPGTLIYFTEDVYHSVMPVSEGIRYNIVMFFADTDLQRPLAKKTTLENFGH